MFVVVASESSHRVKTARLKEQQEQVRERGCKTESKKKSTSSQVKSSVHSLMTDIRCVREGERKKEREREKKKRVHQVHSYIGFVA